jgi:hypothetical protein
MNHQTKTLTTVTIGNMKANGEIFVDEDETRYLSSTCV